jgi:flagellar motor switch protein FliN/FliY
MEPPRRGDRVPTGSEEARLAGESAEAALSAEDLDALKAAAATTEAAVATLDAPADGDAAGSAGSRGAVLDLPDFAGPSTAAIDPKRITMLHDVNLNVKIELGRTRMLIEDVLRLGEGSVVELDKLAGDPVDVYANDRLIARGEVLVLNDSFCVRISEVVSADPHRVSE